MLIKSSQLARLLTGLGLTTTNQGTQNNSPKPVHTIFTLHHTARKHPTTSTMSSSLYRVLRNAWEVGPRSYWKQLNSIGDTKAGRLVGTDVSMIGRWEVIEHVREVVKRW